MGKNVKHAQMERVQYVQTGLNCTETRICAKRQKVSLRSLFLLKTCAQRNVVLHDVSYLCLLASIHVTF